MKAATGAYIGAALFIALMVAFSAVDQTTPSSAMVLLIGAIGVISHLVLLPVVSRAGTASLSRACGYAGIMIDVMLNVATINGMSPSAVTPLRLGGHIPAGLWIADAALAAGGVAKAIGVPLAMLLVVHAMSAPWIPQWVLFIPFTLIPVWLVVLARHLQAKP